MAHLQLAHLKTKLSIFWVVREDIFQCVQNQILICKCLYVFHHFKTFPSILYLIYFTFIVQNWVWSNFFKLFRSSKFLQNEKKIPKGKQFWSCQSTGHLQIYYSQITNPFWFSILKFKLQPNFTNDRSFYDWLRLL